MIKMAEALPPQDYLSKLVSPTAEVQILSPNELKRLGGKDLERILIAQGGSPTIIDEAYGQDSRSSTATSMPPTRLIDNIISFYQTKVDPLDTGKEYETVFALLKEPIKNLRKYDLSQLDQKRKIILSSAFGDYGLALRLKGDFAGAENNYKFALSLDPDNFDTNINLAYLLEKELKRPEEAKPYARKAYDLNPTDSKAKFLKSILGL